MIHFIMTTLPLTLLALPMFILSKLGELGCKLPQIVIEFIKEATGWDIQLR